MVENIISNSAISVLPSQQGLSLSAVASDRLKKMQVLTLANIKAFRNADDLCFLQYTNTFCSLAKIAINALDKEREIME